MARARDEGRVAEAARLYATGLGTRQIGARLGTDPRTVARWLGDGVRRQGSRGRTDVSDRQVLDLRHGPPKLGYDAIARRTGLSKTAVRKRLERLSRETYEAKPGAGAGTGV
jgi:DNA invertase Pin-like site-specific DNA recombinase